MVVIKAKDPDQDAKLEYSITEPIRAMDRTGVPLSPSATQNYKQAFRSVRPACTQKNIFLTQKISSITQKLRC